MFNKDDEALTVERAKEQKEDRFQDREAQSDGYSPVSDLKLPQRVKDKILAQGYKLKWIRFQTRGVLDAKNIRKRLNPREGYSFVRPEELGEDTYLIGDVEEDGRYGDIITAGDLVLMKVRVEKNESRKKYYQDRTKERSDAIQAQLEDNKIQNDSRSVVRTGKNAHFNTN